MEGLSTSAGAEAEGPPGWLISEWEAQATLILAAYRAKHHEQDVNLADWEQNNVDVQNAAMMEWVDESDKKISNSARFRTYAEANPHKRVNPSDAQGIEEMLAAIH